MDVWAYMGGDYMYMCRLSQGILHACCALVRRTQVFLSNRLDTLCCVISPWVPHPYVPWPQS